MRKTIKELKKERLKIVKEMYLNNMTVTEIARELGCGVSTISSYVKELGIRREDKDYEEEILKLLEEGKNNKQIIKELGICSKRIAKVRRKYGIGARKSFIQEEDLIDENTKYAEDYSNVKLEKIIINGKVYEDITPIFSPK